MAVQFNLLPDVKLEYNRAQRAKRLVYLTSSLATGIALALFIITFLTVDVLQKTILNKADSDIKTYSQKLKSIPDLEKILTIQNQLNALPGLQQKTHITSRLFTYLPEVTPANAHIGKLIIDTTADTISIDGTADSVETINKFVDTLKFTTYTNGGDPSTKASAFTNVVLTKVDRNDKVSSYTIDSSFDPNLFMANQDIKLVVPQEITTRSVINSPDTNSNPLFNGQTGNKNNNTNTQGGQ